MWFISFSWSYYKKDQIKHFPAVNQGLQTSVFLHKLKQAEVISLYKKLDSLNKENYRPVSLPPYLSKVFERIIYKQINSYMEDKPTKCLTGFRKLHGT